MSSILNLYAGAEELGLDDVVEEVGEVVEEVVKTEIAELAVEIEEQSAQIEELVDAVEELEEASEEVVEVVEGLESLLNSGNYNATAFASQYKRAAKLTAKLGGQTGSRLGAESLGDASTAQLMARDGIEGFMDTVKGWGKKAADFIKHIFNTVMNFFISLFSQAAAIEKRAEQLKARLDKGSVVEKVKLGGWNAYVDYEKNGTTIKLNDIQLPNDELTGLINSVASVKGGDKFPGVKTAYDALVAWITSMGTAFAASIKDGSEPGSKVAVGQVAAIRLMAQYTKGADITKAEELNSALRGTKLFYKIDSATAKTLKSGEVAAKANASALNGVIQSTISFAKKLRESKVSAKFTNAQRDQIIGMLSAIKIDSDSKDAAKEMDNNIKLVRAVYATVSGVTNSSFKFQTNFRKARLDMVAAHIK